MTRVCLPGTVRAPCSSLASALYRMSLTSVDLPEPDTPVTAMKQPSGNATSTSRRLCSLAPLTTISRPWTACAGVAGTGIDSPAGQVRAGQRLLAGQQVCHRPGDDDLAAVLARAGADVDHPVGGADGVLVVLDHDQRVAQVAQPQQRLEQPVVVPLVQPDGRLVQHVQHADQPGADLGGQPDPLRLAAGQRRRGAVQRQVVQADVEQEAQPGVDLLEDPRRRSACPGRTARAPSSSLASSPIGSAQKSAIDRPSTVTASDTGLSRVPWQVGQGTSRMYPANRSRLESLSASECRRSMYGITPSKLV